MGEVSFLVNRILRYQLPIDFPAFPIPFPIVEPTLLTRLANLLRPLARRLPNHVRRRSVRRRPVNQRGSTVKKKCIVVYMKQNKNHP